MSERTHPSTHTPDAGDESMETRHLADPEWEEHTLETVTEHPEGYDLRFVGAMGFWCPRVDGVAPRPGDTVRLYGRGFGYVVRGLAVNGAVVFYRTEEEQRERDRTMAAEQERKQREEFEREGRVKLDADYVALPAYFQARIDKFRRNNPDFRWRYEGYEMFTCTEAVKIARALGTAEAVQEFGALSWEEQRRQVPDLSDGHSGNTFGMAVRLAYLYLAQPEGVVQMHGALAPLVGSEEYGCVPPVQP